MPRRWMRVLDRFFGVVVIAIGIAAVIDGVSALGESEWRRAFVDLFILAVFIAPTIVMRRIRYAARRRLDLSHADPDSN